MEGATYGVKESADTCYYTMVRYNVVVTIIMHNVISISVILLYYHVIMNIIPINLHRYEVMIHSIIYDHVYFNRRFLNRPYAAT